MPDEMIPDDLISNEALDAALRRAPNVQVPPHFANRILARVPQEAAFSEPKWVRPALMLAAASAAVSLAWAGSLLGLGSWLERTPVAATILGIEAAVTLAWVWRGSRSYR
jgi:hypothetical protein